MSAGQSLADLLMKIGVDADAMTSGFQSANAQTRRMAKDMVDGINASFQKVQTPTIIGSDRAMADRLEFYKKKLEEGRISQETFNKAVAAARRAFESQENGASATAAKLSDLIDLQEKYRASVALMQRETTQNANAMQSAMIRGMSSVGQLPDKLIAGMSESGRLAASVQESLDAASEASTRAAEEELDRRQESINAVNAQRSAARDLAAENARVADDYSGLVQQIQQAEIQARRLARGRSLDAKLAEEAARSDQQQQQQRAALAASLADGEERQRRRIEAAAKVQARLDEDSQRIKQAGADQAVERAENERAINAAVSSESVRQTQAERDVQNLLNQQLERGNETLQFRNRLRREAVAFAQALDEAGITPGSQRYQNLTQEFRESQQRQEEEFRNRDRTNAEIERRNQLDQQATRVIRSVTTAQEAHNQRLTQLRILQASNRISMEQYNRAVRESINVMNSQRAGFSQTSGMLAQLSFGIEDFAQGLAMGDLRAAMLGASNNITMVVRGFMDMDAASRAALRSVLAIPAGIALVAGAAVGIYAAFNWLESATRDARSLADALRDATMGLDKFRQAASARSQMAEMQASVSRMTSLEDVTRREEDLARKRIEAERNVQNVQREAAVEAQAIIENMLGGASARAELEKVIANTKANGSAEEIAAAKEIESLIARSQQAAREGNPESVINNLRRVYELLNEQSLDLADDWVADLTALDALEEFFQTNTLSLGFLRDDLKLAEEDADKLRELREKLLQTNKELTDAEQEQRLIAAELIELEIKRQELAKIRTAEMERQAKWAAAEQNEKQKEELFLIKATEQEREIFRLRQEQQKFVGEQNMQLLGLNPAANFGAMLQFGVQQAEAQADAMAFLEAQKEATQNEMNALMEQAIPKAQGALEQNAFQAQADAFKQMTESIAQKPNPQLTQVVNKLKAIEDAIKNGGSFVQVGP